MRVSSSSRFHRSHKALRARSRRWFSALTVLALAAVYVVFAPQSPATAVTPTGPVADTALNSLWNTYGDQGNHWTGADSTASVALPDGRIAWLFSDTYLGTVNSDHTRSASTPMIHNSMVVEQNGQLGATLYGGTAAAPTSLVDTGDPNSMYWVADGTVEGNSLQVIYNKYVTTGDGSLDFSYQSSALATFSLPALTLTGVQAIPTTGKIAWGNSLLEDGGYTYIYGTAKGTDDLSFVHIARVPAGGLTGAWQFWTGTTWSTTESDSAAVLSGVGTGFSMTKVGSQYLLTTQDDNQAFSANFLGYPADSPTGPFHSPTTLYTAPEPATYSSASAIVYDSRMHPELSTATNLVMSYNVNSLAAGSNTADTTIYRPRFVDIPWPVVKPNPTSVPATPTALHVATTNDGGVHLTWTAPAGSGLTYHVYQRDVTAGQSYPTELLTSYSTAAADLSVDHNGDTFEFSVAATNSSGEGVPTAPISQLVTVVPPGAPTGLTVTTDSLGKVNLSWTAAPGYPTTYAVYQRDVTLGETDFVRSDLASQDTTSAVVNPMVSGHVFEFKVTGLNSGGEGLASNLVQATPHVDAPPTPSGLTATPAADGSIVLAWTSVGTQYWYWVYMRDVTAGDTQLVKLQYPDSSGATWTATDLTQGDTYEFAVAATGPGGDSAQSTAVQATSTPTPPPVPTGLTATAGTDGSIALGWTPTSADGWYWVYEKDVTDGDTDFTKLQYPVTTGSSWTATGLSQDDVYQFEVASIGASGVGDSAPSAAAQATAHYPAPDAPTALTATAGDSQVTLSWTAPAQAVWYWVYRRDVTAGDTDFVRYSYPVSDGTTTTLGSLTDGDTYEFKVTSTGQGGEGAASNVVQVTPSAPPPGVPTSVTATPGTDGSIALSWAAPTGAVWYWVYMRDVTAGQTSFTKLTYPVTSGTSFTATALTNNDVYEFEVSTIGAGSDSAVSAVARATAYYAPPAAPTNLRARLAGNGGITIDWDGPTGIYFWVYYRDVTANQTTFTKLTYPYTDNTASFTGLTNGHTYEFQVTGANHGGEGSASAPVRLAAVVALPAAPTNLTATAGSGQATLAWTASTTAGVLYWIYSRDVSKGQSFKRSTDPLDPSAHGTTFTATGLTNGDNYQFKVSATGSAGEGATSNVASVTPLYPTPAAATGLTATAQVAAVKLSWTASATAGVDYWIMYKDVSAGDTTFSRLTLPVSGATTFTWSGLKHHNFQFEVLATKDGVNSAASGVVSATPLVPAAPTGVTATASAAQVKLTWAASTSANVWYWIWYRDTAVTSKWQQGKYPVNGTSATLGGLLAHNYQYYVVSTGVSGDSAASAVVSATPLPPAAPTGLTATPHVDQVALKWTASVTPNVLYWIDYEDTSAAHPKWVTLKYPISATSFTMTMTLLKDAATHVYQFRIRAIGSSGNSASSNVVSSTPLPPAAPTGLKISGHFGGDLNNPYYRYVNLSWTASVTPNVVYFIYYKTSSAANWTRQLLPTNKLSATVVGVNFGLRVGYSFKVSAGNYTGDNSSDNASWTFDHAPVSYTQVARYMTDQMNTNAWGLEATLMKAGIDSALSSGAPGAIATGAALLNFHRLEQKGGAWDHKPTIASTYLMYGVQDHFYLMMADHPDLGMYYDIWSNIHYGYVGHAIDIPYNFLQWAQGQAGIGAGNTDVEDQIAVKLGYDLFSSHPHGLTTQELEDAITGQLSHFQATSHPQRAAPFKSDMFI